MSTDDSPSRAPRAWVAAAPLLCALHCLAMPVAVALVPAVAPAAAWEMPLFLITAVAVLGILAQGVRTHRQWGPILVAAAGVAGWYASLAEWFAPVPEEATTVVAALVVAAAALWNAARLRRVAAHRCSCAGCEPERAVVPGRSSVLLGEGRSPAR